ncbi:uncharacterized protein BXZ73DRAFT_54208 [Epithele typhae]|uniref:uncharacterized protein n=1 Tax=Epithele typhae TaxID=378194 RepID=UPI00200876E4|nr:uncharacterized protein BXZ73DRAFT_54208 [Epithele typhae]KAH9915556.1 hypothetical protein BXZ73DRAFT_54208 [Epithele typhae]
MPVSPVSSPHPHIWAPGTYVLVNARGGTAVDLHGADDRTLIGFHKHGGENQQWEFIPCGRGYVIRCVRRAKDGHALYLTTEGGVGEMKAVVASPYPVTWQVEQDGDAIRVCWPDTKLVWDLADWGNSKLGTKIHLMERKHKERCQEWHFTRCTPTQAHDHGHDDEHEVVSARALSPPASTETVTVMEEAGHITTTRTTTTTVITTVTEVTRTPKGFLHSPRGQRKSIGYR